MRMLVEMSVWLFHKRKDLQQTLVKKNNYGCHMADSSKTLHQTRMGIVHRFIDLIIISYCVVIYR